MVKYLLWGGVTALGAGLGLIDWRRFRRPWFGLALVGAAGLGYGLTLAFPFSFVDASLFMTGVILVAGAALALSGYAAVGLAWVVGEQWTRLRKARSS